MDQSSVFFPGHFSFKTLVPHFNPKLSLVQWKWKTKDTDLEAECSLSIGLILNLLSDKPTSSMNKLKSSFPCRRSVLLQTWDVTISPSSSLSNYVLTIFLIKFNRTLRLSCTGLSPEDQLQQALPPTRFLSLGRRLTLRKLKGLR